MNNLNSKFFEIFRENLNRHGKKFFSRNNFFKILDDFILQNLIFCSSTKISPSPPFVIAFVLDKLLVFNSTIISFNPSILLLIKTMSSANLRLLSHCPLILIPFPSQSTCLNTSSNTALNKFGKRGSPASLPSLH